MCLKNGFRPRENLNTDERLKKNKSSSTAVSNKEAIVCGWPSLLKYPFKFA